MVYQECLSGRGLDQWVVEKVTMGLMEGDEQRVVKVASVWGGRSGLVKDRKRVNNRFAKSCRLNEGAKRVAILGTNTPS